MAKGKNIVAREERDRSGERWQRGWEDDSRGRWTYTLIPDFRTWEERQHGEVDYYVTQPLSGHGNFKAFLHKMGKVDSLSVLTRRFFSVTGSTLGESHSLRGLGQYLRSYAPGRGHLEL